MARPLVTPRARVIATGPGLVLELRDPTGRCGRGEASPLAGYSPDTVAACRAALEPLGLPPLWLDRELLAQIRTAVDLVPATLPAARCAVDTALLDLAGQILGRSSWQLLGGSSAGPVVANAVVDSLAGGRAALARGFTTLKVKVGRRRWADELDLARRLREELGAAVALRFDANQRWSLAQARIALADLAALDPEYVEEPVASVDLCQLGPSPVALAVDESLAGSEPDFAELRRRGVTVAVLKPMLLGGLVRCRDLAAAARAAGVDPVVSHMLGGPIELAAAGQLAIAIGARRACGLAPHPNLGAWPPAASAVATRARLSVLAAAASDPEQVALVVEGRAHRFAELVAPVAATMTWLRERGVTGAASERVAVIARPSYATAVLLYALLELRVTAVLVDPRLPAIEQRRRIDQAGVTLTVAEAWQVPNPGASTARRSWPPAARERDAGEDDRILAVLFTSASAGVAKPVELSRRSFVAAADASAANLGWRAEDRWLVCLPLAHVGGFAILVRCLVGRRAAVIAGGFDVDRVISLVATASVSLLSLVPTMLDRLLAADWRPPPTLRAVLLGGAASPRSLLDRVARRDLPILASYGMTETCGQIATRRWAPSSVPPEPRHPGGERIGSPAAGPVDVGPALPGVELRIADDGAIWVRTPALFSRYGSPHDAAAPVDHDGWFDTGDRGFLDAAGNLHVAGRRDDTIVTGGDNVHPDQVEEIVRGYPGIRDACVFGLPDPRWGQIVVAAVVGDPEVDLGRLDGYLRVHLASYQRPRRLIALPALPLGPTGKVDRAAVIAAAARDDVVP